MIDNLIKLLKDNFSTFALVVISIIFLAALIETLIPVALTAVVILLFISKS